MKNPKSFHKGGYYPNAAHQKVQRSKRRRLWLAAMLGCVAVFAVCLTLLIGYFSDIARSREATANLRGIYEGYATQAPQPNDTMEPEVSPQANAEVPAETWQAPQAVSAESDGAPTSVWPATYEKNPRMLVSEQFLKLKEMSRDIIGWLRIDGVLDEPVVQRDNKFYLTHDYRGKKNVTGALFLDESCDLRTVPANLIVHGHNMKEGAMFGALKKYKVKDVSFYREHPYVEMNTIYENSQYVIFAVAEVDIRPEDSRYFPFWSISQFGDNQAFTDFVSRVKALSHYRCDVKVEPGDRLLTLATCLGDDENKRLVVMARRIRESEDRLALNIDVYTATDR